MPKSELFANVPKVDELRILARLTKEQFAEKAKISRRTLNSLYDGKPGNISTFGKLATALDVSIDVIIMPPPKPTTGFESLLSNLFTKARAAATKPIEPPIDTQALDAVRFIVLLGYPTEFEEFDETTNLMHIVNRVETSLGSNFKVLGVIPSSVSIAFEMPSELAAKFLIEWKNGVFADRHFAQVTCLPDVVIPSGAIARVRRHINFREEGHAFIFEMQPDGSCIILLRGIGKVADPIQTR